MAELHDMSAFPADVPLMSVFFDVRPGFTLVEPIVSYASLAIRWLLDTALCAPNL
jgi:hypothetical protein